MKEIKDMTEPELQELMSSVANAVKEKIPEKTLFAVLVFDEPGLAQYVSNVQRADMVKALREAADKLESQLDVSR